VLCLAACGTSTTSKKPDPNTRDPASKSTNAASAADPFVQLQRVDGSKFVEILEVKALADGRVLYCSGVKGLVILDARTPGAAKPIHTKIRSKLSHARFPRCQHLAVEGKYIYVTNRGDEVQTTPFVAAFDDSGATPKEVATYIAKNLSIEGVTAAGKYVYVAAHDRGILVLEHSGASLKQLTNLTGFQNAWAIAAHGNHLYVADGKAGLVVVDVTAPSRPRIVGRAKFDGNSQSLTLDPKTMTAWVAAGSGGVVAVDVSAATRPRVVGSYDSPGSALQVALSNRFLFVADWNDVRVLDIKDRTKPRVVASERIKTGGSYSRVLGVSANKNYAFVGEWTGLYAYEFKPNVAAPDLWLETERMDFGTIAAGKTDKNAVIVENHGNKKLTVNAIEVTGTKSFSIDKTRLTLQPGGVALVHINFAPVNDGEAEARLVFRSDDPDEPSREVVLTGNTETKGVGQQVPEVLGKRLRGGEFKLSSLRGKVVVLAYFSTF